jgi:predicted small lipoprotein YifL
MRKNIFILILAVTLLVGVTGCGKKDYEYYSKKVPKIESQEKLNEILTEAKDNEDLTLIEKGKITGIIAKRKAELALGN